MSMSLINHHHIPLLNLKSNCRYVSQLPIIADSFHVTSKKPNSYGVSWGPMMRALTFRTSMSRQATARAKESCELKIHGATVLETMAAYKDPSFSGGHSAPIRQERHRRLCQPSVQLRAHPCCSPAVCALPHCPRASNHGNPPL